jgi:hypothetical protein
VRRIWAEASDCLSESGDVLELLAIVGLLGALVSFVLAAWKGFRGAIASLVVGTVFLFLWFLVPSIEAHLIKSVEPVIVLSKASLLFSLPWWIGAFPGAAMGIATRKFMARRISR